MTKTAAPTTASPDALQDEARALEALTEAHEVLFTAADELMILLAHWDLPAKLRARTAVALREVGAALGVADGLAEDIA